MTLCRVLRLSLAGLIVAGLAGSARAQSPSHPASTAGPSAGVEGGSSGARDAANPTIVLVHGAFADGTGWQRVIPILERHGYTVIRGAEPARLGRR